MLLVTGRHRRPPTKETAVRIGASLALFAIGAILKWAVSDHVKGVNLSVVGVILMIVGVVGLVLTMIMLAMDRRRTDVVMHDHTYERPPVDRY
jgi:hypothetical protein